MLPAFILLSSLTYSLARSFILHQPLSPLIATSDNVSYVLLLGITLRNYETDVILQNSAASFIIDLFGNSHSGENRNPERQG